MHKFITYYRLGLVNILRIIFYRIMCKIGFYKYIQPIGSTYSGPFWEWPKEIFKISESLNPDWVLQAEKILNGEMIYYSYDWRQVNFPPIIKEKLKIHWSDLDEFTLSEGDIKNLWESSRFCGILILALAYLNTGDIRFSNGIEKWLVAWIQESPANLGIQWKCGQETGIRLMHILLVHELLYDHVAILPTRALERFVLEHCNRIVPTMIYAIAQDNNHGTSEAAALYMAGLWLKKYFPENKSAQKYYKNARYWLENRAQKLIMNDGSFAQYSMNYHRLMLDTISMSEYWRLKFNDKKFSSKWYKKAILATNWLTELIDPNTGYTPNLGSNDGARIFVLYKSSYRDFRPTAHFASILFKNCSPFEKGEWDELSFWLKIEDHPQPAAAAAAAAAAKRSTILFPTGGYIKLTADQATWGVFRLPNFSFRPNHSDALHFDLWRNGINWLRDGGTYSYNTDEKWLKYFPGTSSHSTIQFDDRDQMPRLGRFLFGHWLRYDQLFFNSNNPNTATASYIDYLGAQHSRTIDLQSNYCTIIDEVSGFNQKSILRLRLPPINWKLNLNSIASEECLIEVICDQKIFRSELVIGYESLHYDEITSIPVFEIETQISPARFITTIRFQDKV